MPTEDFGINEKKSAVVVMIRAMMVTIEISVIAVVLIVLVAILKVVGVVMVIVTGRLAKYGQSLPSPALTP